MRLRSFVQRDLTPLIDLTIETFGPFYERSFRPLVGDAVFAHQHGHWREDYRAQVSGLHDPANNRYVAVAERGDVISGYVAWTIDPERRHGDIEILAVSVDDRRKGVGTALCAHAFDHMRQRGVEVVVIGTGGDPFHAPARALYESLGCTHVPVEVYFKQLGDATGEAIR